jgi:hypothetical protein
MNAGDGNTSSSETQIEYLNQFEALKIGPQSEERKRWLE